MTIELYDKLLQGTDFARSSLENFLRMDRAATLALSSRDPAQVKKLVSELPALESAVLDDLQTVQERLGGTAPGSFIAEIRTVVGEWTRAARQVGERASRPDAAAGDAAPAVALAPLLQSAEEKFDLLIESA